MSEPVRFSNYGNGPSLHGKLLELISGARRRVWIKVPWWDTSTPARALLDAVVAAKRRGVEVLVLSRPEASNDAVHRELRAAGVKLVAVRYIHEKELIADDEAITYSMNFTGTEIERNENSGNRFTRPEDIEPLEAGFRTLVDNRAAASLGDEQWTGADKIICRRRRILRFSPAHMHWLRRIQPRTMRRARIGKAYLALLVRR